MFAPLKLIKIFQKGTFGMTTPIFSEDFYSKRLAKTNQRVRLNNQGTFEFYTYRSTLWHRFRHYATFQQDPYVCKVHDQLKAIVDETKDKSGPLFNHLAVEVHEHGEKKYKNLNDNLGFLRNKLDQSGQTNVVSKLILKIVNLFRKILGKEPIIIKSFARVMFEREQHFWMGNYSRWFSLSKYKYSSFSVNLYNVEQLGLSLTHEDKLQCAYSAESQNPKVDEYIQKLERGLTGRWLIKQSCKYFNIPHPIQVLADLEITFDPNIQKFAVQIRNPKTGMMQNDSKALIQHLESVSNDQKLVRYPVIVKEPDGNTKQIELSWTYGSSVLKPHQLDEGSDSFFLEPGVGYEFRDDANNELVTFTLLKR
jgi:hypothetical protein